MYVREIPCRKHDRIVEDFQDWEDLPTMSLSSKSQAKLSRLEKEENHDLATAKSE